MIAEDWYKLCSFLKEEMREAPERVEQIQLKHSEGDFNEALFV